MIAKGNLHAHGVNLADYLTADYRGERAELVELRGFVADNIRDAFIDVQIQAEATHATKPFFHAYVRLPDGEELSRERWAEVADRLEEKLGFEDQPRAVAFHHGTDGTTHMHIAWSRIDLETMKAIDPGLYKNKMKELCREMEQELGLTRVKNERDAGDKTKAPRRDEFEEARRLGSDLKEIRNTIHDCWQSADTGKAFAAALEEEGLILARGDKRDFVVVDREGGSHALSKRITDATAAETRARMADIDRASLPSVDEAKAMQHERQATPEQGRGGDKEPPHDPPHAPMVAVPEPAHLPAVIEPPPVNDAKEKTNEPEPDLRVTEKTDDPPPVQSTDPALTGGDSPVTTSLDMFTTALHDAFYIGRELIREGRIMVNELRSEKDLTTFAAQELALRGDEPPPRQFTAAEYATDPAARRAYRDQQRAERERDEGLDHIREDMNAGRPLAAGDVQSLRTEDLQHIVGKGDDHLREIIRDREKEQATKDNDRGRERER